MSKLLLVRPAGGPAQLECASYEHLGLGYLAAYLTRNGIPVDICDAVLDSLTDAEVAGKAAAGEYALVGLSIPSQASANSALDLARIIKNRCPTIHLCLGGHFPTAAHQLLMRDYPYVDSVVRGEGEQPLLQLALRLFSDCQLAGVAGLTHRVDGQIIVEGDAAPLVDLDALPFPTRLDPPPVIGGIPYASMASSRGCQYRCTYCSIHGFYDHAGWRGRSVTNIVDEMSRLYDEGIRGFYFVDDNFVPPSGTGEGRVFEFCQALRERCLKDLTLVAMLAPRSVSESAVQQLVDVGLRSVLVGLESASTSSLRRWHKATSPAINSRALRLLRGFPLTVTAGFIMFDPDTTLTEIRSNLDFLRSYADCIDDCRLLNRLEVYVGTSIYNRLRKENRLTGTYLTPQYEFAEERVAWLYEVATGLFARWDEKLDRSVLSVHEMRPGQQLTLHHRIQSRRAFVFLLAVLDELTSLAERAKSLPDVEETCARLTTPVDNVLKRLTEAAGVRAFHVAGGSEPRPSALDRMEHVASLTLPNW